MNTPKHLSTKQDGFGPVISTYTRADALSDGVLIDAGPMAQEASFKVSVALTIAAWNDCVAWTDADSDQQVCQDQSGRLWDVLMMALYRIRSAIESANLQLFKLYRVPRDGVSTNAKEVTLKLIIGPGDQGEPVITIMLPNED